MGMFGKLFGAKADKDKNNVESSPNSEDITLFIQRPTDSTGTKGEAEGFGLQFILQTGKEKTFSNLPIMIGRGEENDIDLSDASVSATHARVYFDERVGSICIEDQHSLNGVRVNSLPTSKNILRDGDKIQVGSFEMTFKDTGFIYQDS